MGYLPVDSAVATRFLASVGEGYGLKRSARAAGVHLETGYRWLGQRYGRLRDQGLSPQAALAELGCQSSKATGWELQYAARKVTGGRHHLQVPAAREAAFWTAFDAGVTPGRARGEAAVGRSTAYRWLQRRFCVLRGQGLSVGAAASQLRVALPRARAWEAERHRTMAADRRERETADRRAVRASARHAEALLRPRAPRSGMADRDTRYWQLMRSGLTNTAASKVLGVSRRTGTLIRVKYRVWWRLPTAAERVARQVASAVLGLELDGWDKPQLAV